MYAHTLKSALIGYRFSLLEVGSSRLVLTVAFHRNFHLLSLKHLRKRKMVGRLFLQTPYLLPFYVTIQEKSRGGITMGRHGGASNSAQNEVCPYCGRLLKISDGNKKFVSS